VPFDTAKLAIVFVVAAAMVAIAVHAVLRSRRMRREEREADLRRLRVTVTFNAPDLEDWCGVARVDGLDDRLAAAALGEVADARCEPSRAGNSGADATADVAIDVTLESGQSALPRLKRILLDAGVPAEARLAYRVSGVEARERVGR
jgi:hypothetical protein